MKHSDPASISLAVLAAARAGRFAEVRGMFARPQRRKLSAEGLQAAWAEAFGRHEPVTSIGTPASEAVGGGVVAVTVPVVCEHERLTMVVSVDGAGRLVNIQVTPTAEPWVPPGYADADGFSEQDVILGSGPLAVPGTLTLPNLPGPKPAVVLLCGGGPFDRDMTMGRNKIGKDLAWGLASRGVAVLRFDKVTHAHADLVAQIPGFTPADEYVPHAVAAVELLRQHPEVDPAKVFVAGHSMGGAMAPRVAAAEPSVAGLVLLAGGAQPMHHAAVRVVRYLAALRPGDPAGEAAVAAITEQAGVVESVGLDSSTPAGKLPFGYSAAFWLSMRSYDPVAIAAELPQPMLVLQGGRDYQVTVADDFALWQAGLASRADVTMRVHDADNHLFFVGAGVSQPAEYDPAQHVDPAVVAEIADWLIGH